MSPRPLSDDRAWSLVGLWAVAALSIHQIGNTTGLYFNHWWFQIFAHFCSATALAALAGEIGMSAGLRWSRLAALVVLVTASGGLLWELVEFLGIFPNLHFHGINDSLLDMSANAVGLAVVLALFRLRVRRVTDRDGEPAAMAFGREQAE